VRGESCPRHLLLPTHTFRQSLNTLKRRVAHSYSPQMPDGLGLFVLFVFCSVGVLFLSGFCQRPHNGGQQQHPITPRDGGADDATLVCVGCYVGVLLMLVVLFVLLV